MNNPLKYCICAFLSASALTSCVNYKKLLTDEIVLRDGNSHTGTIIQCDSTNLKLQKTDESIRIIPWTVVDTVKGKKLKTVWFGANFGYYNTPYFSVFRNESMSAKNAGFQLKIGLALRGIKLYYINLAHIPDQPYAVTKFGLGYQRYLGKATYTSEKSFFAGSELNLMNVKFNNGPQITLEPFMGFEKKLNERLRIHFKFGLQLNLANKNNQSGANTTIGIHFMKRDFKKYYDILNREYRLPGK